MVAFFPNISSSAFEWQLEDGALNELFAYYSPNLQDAHNSSITSYPHPPDFDSKDLNFTTIPSKDHPLSMKRSIHNEYERDRRKKLNSLYSSLRNLLPETDQNVCASSLSTLRKHLNILLFFYICIGGY